MSNMSNITEPSFWDVLGTDDLYGRCSDVAQAEQNTISIA